MNGIDKYAPLSLGDSLIVSLVSMLVVFLVLTIIMFLIKLIGVVSKESNSSSIATIPAPVTTSSPTVPAVDVNAVPQEHVAVIMATLSVMLNTSAANINITKITAK